MVVVEVGADVEVDVVGLDDVEAQVDVHTAVHHAADVAPAAAVTGGHGVGNRHEHVLGVLVVELDGEVEEVPQAGGEADVEALHGLPCQVGVGGIGHAPALHSVVLSAVVADGTVGQVVADGGVTGGAVAGVQAQVVDPVGALHPLLVLDVPHRAHGVEVGVPAVLSEEGRAVESPGGVDEVPLAVVVGQAGEVGVVGLLAEAVARRREYGTLVDEVQTAVGDAVDADTGALGVVEDGLLSCEDREVVLARDAGAVLGGVGEGHLVVAAESLAV